MDKLKRCPLCGGEARFFQMGITKNIRLGYVKCTECGLRLEQENCTEDFATAQWNTRKPMDRIVERLEKLRTCDDFGTCNHCQYRWCSMELLSADDAIKIVKEEGV